MRKLRSPLLDSSLITQTNLMYYNTKIVRCGDYVQVYAFRKDRLKKDSTLVEELSHYQEKINYEKHLLELQNNLKSHDIIIENPKELNLLLDYILDSNNNQLSLEDLTKIDELLLNKPENKFRQEELKVIEFKNICRSKFQLQRLVKANEKIFKTFITLTFRDNITSIGQAHKEFNSWRTYINRIYPDFKYVAVPEFQKRGSVHYHLLTNIDINNKNLVIPQKGHKKCYDIIGWNKGFSSVFSMKDINVVGYICKYMTKDVDNRLFGKRRYYHSNNLVIPTVEFLNLSEAKHIDYISKITNNSDITFQNEYIDFTTGLNVSFVEYKK